MGREPVSGAGVIRGPADVIRGARWLARQDEGLDRAISLVGEVPLRLRPGGFKGLLDILVSQQVSVASADAIRNRMQKAGIFSEEEVLAAGVSGLRDLGFSRAKADYALVLAEARLDYVGLEGLSDEEVMDRLTDLRGIGPWTAQVYLMFCMGRADVFPPGDLALQEATRILYGLPARPGPRELAARAEGWSPWRSVAARALFAYYRETKGREGLR